MENVSIDRIFKLGIALSAEKDRAALFGMILNEAMDLTNSDAGTIYILENEQLRFNYMITRSKNVDQSADRNEITIPPVPMSRSHVCACCALDKQLINIEDIYLNSTYDFAGAQRYDALNDYRTKSMPVVPMLDDTDDCIGVLQLINATKGNAARSYDEDDEKVIRALASFAAVSLNNRLLSEEINDLLHSFVTVMVGAIDTRSPYNANHTKSMVKYGEKFLDWVDRNDCDFKIRDKDKDPFIMSIWLHDIGKLLIPLEIMDKATRLGDRLKDINNRITIAILMEKLADRPDKVKALEEARDFIVQINEAGFMPDEKLERVSELAKMSCLDENGNEIKLLKDDEIASLSIRKGTLTEAERHIMESHVEYTMKMRLGWDDCNQWKEVLDCFDIIKPKYVAVHPRIGKQQYKGELLMDGFTELYHSCHYPIIYNGEILSVEHIMQIKNQFPCIEGVMVGRGLVATPFMLSMEQSVNLMEFHTELLEQYSAHLSGGDMQILNKMKSLWTMFLPQANHKLRKAISKSRNLDQYVQASTEAIKSVICT